ncbi:MAG TPA: sn-glycerol-3-phosphate ABC transporter ATP-binding protein UgpC [Acidimicrobiales bacterium]|jgi:multiple sugar transport system ATP-binding protein|nr:sn-glycerol-3-phosphate ABC transporter ATP-binding protein UgpC [Acidimicrobiales bacterium]
MAGIAFKGITKRYPDGTEAVHDVDLDIADGEFLVLVGPSGCGKSTLLRMLAGLEDISDGELCIGDEVVNTKAPKDRHIAMVFQNYALYPHLTVRENMAFPLKLAKVPKDEIDKRVNEAAQTLDLTENLDRKPANLSGGQRQRVAMGRAIVRDPKVFLLDEPLSNLDAKLRVQMRTEVARIQHRLNATTVYVTHDQTEAMTLGDRVAVMRKGVLQQVASPSVLYDSPANLFVAGFIGSPAMNFLPVTVEGGKARLALAEIDLPAEVAAKLGKAGRSLVAGIRPEHFEDAALVAEGDRHKGPTFTAQIDVVESMGSDLFVHFNTEAEGGLGGELESVGREIAPGGGSRSDQSVEIVARLNAASKVERGAEAELWFDAERVLYFDAETGENLTRRPSVEGGGEGGEGRADGGEVAGPSPAGR